MYGVNTIMNLVAFCNKVIEYSFYALFFLVPLVFASNTSELFELNKMWLTWGLTIVIGAFWFTKMILQRKIFIQKTPLDLFIGLFLTSQIISTIFSWDRHISFWGYYSRFNGGLLSIVTYIFLYYAFVSNFEDKAKVVFRILYVSLISGLIVALWGLPSHFGYDPTCFIFRGNFDVSCWTADFLPRVRIFSTLGQPAWLAAYLAILIPIATAFLLSKWKMVNGKWKILLIASLLSLIALFYIDLLFTLARSGILGLYLSLAFFFLSYVWIKRKSIKSQSLPLTILIVVFLIITFIIGIPIPKLNNFTLPGLRQNFERTKLPNIPQDQPPQPTVSGGTESGEMRLLVWEGALNAWKNHPLFGTGVETFAFAYYKYKPVGQNLTSEWNFLYNKAHNEYLNYLSTTGLFGLGSYLAMIGGFIFLFFKNKSPNIEYRTFLLGLLASYISILITNFFGFSVVITNIYLFLIPAFVFILGGMIPQEEKNLPKVHYETTIWQWTPIFLASIAALFMLITLFNFWRADIAYAKGYNLSRIGENQLAYQDLHHAVQLRDEPVFKDELAANNAILVGSLLSDPNKKEDPETLASASSLARQAITISDQITSMYPNNIVFWKARVAIFFALSQVDARYLASALEAIEKASRLAPNDANIFYNLGVLYGRNNKIAEGIEALEKTVILKSDYADARYALGLFYRTAAMDQEGTMVINRELNQKAIDQMQYILTHLAPNNTSAIEAIKDWKK